jgi:uncharacterized protein (UPF0332 family)
MDASKLKWCFGLKDGLKVMEPNERLAKTYLDEATASLARAEKNFADGDLLWATVVVYYAEYYALYAFLQRIGVKCENHACSILAATVLLGEEFTKTINSHRGKRIDAQYYMRVGKEQEVSTMLKDAKIFVSIFDELVSNLNKTQIEQHRNVLKKMS